MFNAGTVTANITANTSGFDKGISNAEKGASKLSGVFGAVAKTAAAVGAVAVGSGILIGKSAIKSAIDLEQTSVAFEVMLGNADKAKETLASLTEFAKTTPFELPEIQTAAKSLLAFGFEADQLEPTLRSLGDVSAGLNIPIGEMSELYGKARTQGRLFAEDINQLTGRGIPIIAELAKQFSVSESEVKKLVESGDVGFENLQTAMQNMTSEGGQFFGLMEKQSQTFGGTISNLKDSFGLLTRAIVGIDPQGNIQPGGLFDQFKGLANNLLTVLNNNKDTIINISQNALTKLFNALTTVGKLIVDVSKFYMEHKNTIDAVGITVLALAVSFKTLNAAMQFAGLVKNMTSLFSTLGFGPGSVLAVLAVTIAVVYGEWKTLKDTMDSTKTSVQTLTEQNQKLQESLENVTDPERRAELQAMIDKNNEWATSAQTLETRYDGVLGKIRLVADAARNSTTGGGLFGGVLSKFGGGLNSGGIIGADSVLKFASGGVVPGKGSRDSVLAALTPGEVIVNPQRQDSVDAAMGLLNGGGKAINLNGPININSNVDLDALTYKLGLLYKTL